MAEDARQYALDKHKEWQGKIEVITRAPITTPDSRTGWITIVPVGTI